ncbi:MAG: metallophosphoesterase [Halofilum sp. (in: g-proteobacteria)]
MRIQALSDLHMELQGEMPLPDPGADVVVLAGDIAAGAEGVAWAGRTWPDRPVVYVMGNHEFYGGDIAQVLAAARGAARGTSVHVLEQDSVVVDGVRFLGATLWTDFALHGAESASSSRAAARRNMPDFRLIAHEGAPLTPETTMEWHRDARTWLERELAAERDEPTVVVSHHAPHPRSNHYDGDPMSPAFVSDLSATIECTGPAVWIHGHTHSSEDYRAGATRLVANQVGYAGEPTGWDPHWTIDVSP